VTLWGGRAHAERTLDWLATADLPPQSTLYWLDNSGGKFTATLREQWHQRLRRRFLRLAFIHGGAPYTAKPGEGLLDPGRHIHITRLYNRIFGRVTEDMVVTLEDDLVPPRDAVRSLLRLWQASDRIGLAAGVYRDRVDPRRPVVAPHQDSWQDIPPYEALPAEPFEAAMVGGGFLLMANQALQQVLPVRCRRYPNGHATGWDGTLCADLKALGYRVMVDPTVRCAHLCKEVLAYEETLKASASPGELQ
jgi:hypothetical protein